MPICERSNCLVRIPASYQGFAHGNRVKTCLKIDHFGGNWSLTLLVTTHEYSADTAFGGDIYP